MEELNMFYYRLESKATDIVNNIYAIYSPSWGWYNGHFHKNKNGEWERENFPIPVITLKGLCDIEIGINRITLSTKLSRSTALEYQYEKIKNIAFEAYGVENYLLDFYTSDMRFDDFYNNILMSDEKEIGFSFIFDFDESVNNIKDVLHFIKQEGFYY